MKKIIHIDGNIDKEIIRDDILSETYDRLSNMNVKEIIRVRDIIFNIDNINEIIEVKKEEISNKKMTIYKANSIISKRYISILENKINYNYKYEKSSPIHLIKMCNKIIEVSEKWPDDKSSRWLGYIQGVMTVNGFINVDDEREYSRNIFHKVYYDNGIELPKSESI